MAKAPPSFAVGRARAVPCEFYGACLEFVLDAAQGSGVATVGIEFSALEDGFPFLDLAQDPTFLELDGAPLSPSDLRLAPDPSGETTFRLLATECRAGVRRRLQLRHPIGGQTAQFVPGGVRLRLAMRDGADRGFLERHSAANLEFNQCPLNIEVELRGTTRPHRIFSNGMVQTVGSHHWRVTFPAYFTCSSPYLHITEEELAVETVVLQGRQARVPITVYGAEAGVVQSALEATVRSFREFEHRFGPYAHPALLVWLRPPNVGNNMEYCGAVTTLPASLRHEILHCWFGRGVLPANGQSGWMDEAIARWGDSGFPAAARLPMRPPVLLTGTSPYQRRTQETAYREGRWFLMELDRLLGAGTLPLLLARWFQAKKLQVTTTEEFQAFLQQQVRHDLGPRFARYVYEQDVPVP